MKARMKELINERKKAINKGKTEGINESENERKKKRKRINVKS